jgi:hypothetical protein
VSDAPNESGLAARLEPVRLRALIAGLAGLAVCGLCALVSQSLRVQFFRWYLWAFVDWLGVALGCLVVLMIQHLTGGAWGLALRRLLEAATRTLPVLAALFLPLVFGIKDTYPWANPEVLASDPELREQPKIAYYLRPDLFLLRVPVYFAVWIGLAYLLNRWSRQQTRAGSIEPGRHFRLLSAPGIGLYGLTITFAAVDWVMSLEPKWYSTIYGPMFAIGQVNAGFSFVLMAAVFLRYEPPLDKLLSRPVMRDCGNLLMAFVLVWAYLSFSQFLLIWSGNLPEEVTWYLVRSEGAWLWVAIGLAVFHFAVPFALLLSRDTKLDPLRLARVAGLVLCMQAVNVLWLIMPAFAEYDGSGAGGEIGVGAIVLGAAAQFGVGGTWLAAFLWQLGRQPLELSPFEEAASHG